MSHPPAQGPGAPRPPADFNPRSDAPLDFPDRTFGELSAGDYDALGLMAGLEVHQQLLTRGKLFCRCPAGRRSRRVDFQVLRRMRPTLSELGEYDGCALMEFKTRKEIVYQVDRELVCTYELDDTPPFPIDEEAVRSALEICRLLKGNLVSELHVMRKQYLDGSIPTGFQRTVMIGLGGVVPFAESELGSGRELRIRQVSLEEDSCREVADVGHRITFRTDRLGVPLIEMVTEPDLRTPLDVRAAGRLLSRVVRTTGKVRRGAGAARQDVNVSVAGGRRIEIKGVGHQRGLPLLVHNEAVRQLNLLRVRAELAARGIRAEHFELPREGAPWECSALAIDARPVLKRCDYQPLSAAIEGGDFVCAVRLPGLRHLLVHRTQPGLVFAHELAERARVIACLSVQPFMIHSDIEGYGLPGGTWKQLRSALKTDSLDAIFVLWGDRRDVATGAREVLARCSEALVGVPAETRQAFADGTTGFERILPGPDRMYPDTDTPPLPIPDAWVEEIERALPERPWEREERLRTLGLDPAAARRLVTAPWAPLFEELAPRSPTAARTLAAALEKRLVHFWRERRTRALPAAQRLRPLVAALESGNLPSRLFEPLFDQLLRRPASSPEDLLAGVASARAASELLANWIEVARHERAAVRGSGEETVLRWAMGRVLRRLRGKVDPLLVRRRLIAALDLREVP